MCLSIDVHDLQVFNFIAHADGFSGETILIFEIFLASQSHASPIQTKKHIKNETFIEISGFDSHNFMQCLNSSGRMGVEFMLKRDHFKKLNSSLVVAIVAVSQSPSTQQTKVL